SPPQKNIIHIPGIIDEFYNQCEKTGIDCILITDSPEGESALSLLPGRVTQRYLTNLSHPY
ncbi:hypothetical protein ACNKEV_004798, partial [Escherichia coli]